MEEEYFTAIGVLQKIGINFVGIDFDVRMNVRFHWLTLLTLIAHVFLNV